MSTYTSIDFRAQEQGHENIEIGVFAGEDCREVIKIPRHEARNYVKALQKAIRDSVVVWWACPECGCTDVQDQVWIDVNTDEPHDSCDRYMWCPQCAQGDGETLADGEIGGGLVEVTSPKPCVTPTEDAKP